MSEAFRKTRVLIVDDELEWAEETAHHLASLPAHQIGSHTLELQLANDACFVADQVCQASGASPWDIIISDVFMPKPTTPKGMQKGTLRPRRVERRWEGRTYVVWESDLGTNDPDIAHGGFLIAKRFRDRLRTTGKPPPKLVLVSSRLTNPHDRRRLNEFLPSEASWFDYYEKAEVSPAFRWRDFKRALLQAILHLDSELWGQLVLASALDAAEFIAKSPAMDAFLTSLYDLVDRGEREVLIVGERHTGKRSLRGIIHRRLQVRANSTRIPCERVFCPELLEGDFEKLLFGSKPGGDPQTASPTGLLQASTGGLLFLEDVHELRAEPLARLVNLLRGRRTRREGPALLPALVVCTANDDLEMWREGGSLPQELNDLFAGSRLRIPALGERQEDIEAFAAMAVRRAGLGMRIAPSAMEWLKQRDWPGNLVQFTHEVGSRARSCLGTELGVADFEIDSALSSTPARLTEAGVTTQLADEPASAAAKEKAANVFKRLPSGMWEVRFRGKDLGPFEHRVGMHYINYLLARAGYGHQISSADLYAKFKSPLPDTPDSPLGGASDAELVAQGLSSRHGQASGGKVLDERYKKELEQGRQSLQAELDSARKAGDLEKVQELEEKLDQIRRVRFSQSKHRGRASKSFQDPAHSEYTRIANALDTCYQNFSDAHATDLARHLKKSIDGRGGFAYTPGESITWKT